MRLGDHPVDGVAVVHGVDGVDGVDPAALGDRELEREMLAAVRLAEQAAALVEMAVRAQSAPPGARRPAPLLLIVAGDKSFERLCELSTGTVIAPGEVVPWLSRCVVQSIIFDSATTAVRGSPQRNFTGLLRRVVQVRDRHCTHLSGCDEPMSVCDVDHRLPHRHGGPTDQDNGDLMCTPRNRHHHLRHPSGTGASGTDGVNGAGGDSGPPSPSRRGDAAP